jgi:hypothetical protein
MTGESHSLTKMASGDADRIIDPVFCFYRGDEEDDNVPEDVTHVLVASTVREIPKLAFYQRDMLTEVKLPEGLRVIAHRAFAHCISLRTVTFPSTVRHLHQAAFFYCTSLTSVDLPEGLAVIGSMAFGWCAFRTLRIPSTVIKIGAEAIANCRSLVFLELNEGLVIIGNEALASCYALRSLRIPSTVRAIGDRAFECCNNMLSLQLPDARLKVIGHEVFSGCRSLINLFIPSTIIDFGDSIFFRCTKLRQPFLEADEDEEEYGYDNDDINNLLINAFQKRFDGLPTHKLCYLQPSSPTRAIVADGVDAFGMTPFHILALSQDPSFPLFVALMEKYPIKAVTQQDRLGNPPIYYLCSNSRQNSMSLIQHLITATVMDQLKWLGLDQWRIDVSSQVGEFFFLADDAVDRKQRQIGQIYDLLAKYQRLEAISLLEMLLWKLKITEAEKCNATGVEIDRWACRVNCEAVSVILNVLPFVDPIQARPQSLSPGYEE